MRKIILTILVVLAGAYPVRATTITFSSGHYIWTDADPYYDEVFLENDASLDFLSGVIGHLDTWHNSLANIDGGTMEYLCTYGNSVVNLYTGQWNWLVSDNDSKVYLYAYNVTYDPTGGIYGDGYFEGYFYKDNTEFDFSLLNPGTYPHVQIVPEPNMLLLLTLGIILLRRHN